MGRPPSDDVHPHLMRLLEHGIRLDTRIEPVLMAQCCRLNMERFDGVQVDGEFHQLVYKVFGRRIARISWFADGAAFRVLWDSQRHLMEMMGQVLHTIRELEEL